MAEGSGSCGAETPLAEAYARWRKSSLGSITDALERWLLLELIGDVRGRTVLDVGCGDGELAVALWERGARVSGIDASAAMIMAARRRALRQGADIPFAVGTAERLPFAPAAFERVVAVTVLCFVDDAAPALGEIGRVLRPGGRLVIGELGQWSTWAAERRLRGWLGHPVWRRARFRTADELRDLVGKAGLTVEDLRGAIFYPPCGSVARLSRGIDRSLGRLTTFGAAFLALAAFKSAKRLTP
ncbi:MAG: methyltransferase domain-containing protein [Defluviicoccus sp.]